MSSTNIHVVRANGDVEIYAEVKNSFAGAMKVWNSLNAKYDFRDNLFTEFKKTFSSFNKGVYEDFENVVLGSTFDNVIVKKEDIQLLIAAYEKYIDEFDGSNLGLQIEIFRQIENKADAIGIAWCQTSVCDDLWDFGYDEEKDELIPYNIYKGDDHWFLFDNILTKEEQA
ncbi:hypothetical protein [Listeria monocytogenes]|uniref:hypothetical protein n=1 Tax=Listeria monocytogenes TaxID=1639 RepID=UPI00136625F7|nr:hypothetical protein [Listeria monocytogenes]EJG7554940.1 hypothetical protein [Listeria monocytogenes]EJG7694974.1 hypothetical protein [Listeria monocytogenes]EJS0276268.1 hypothetical protein [Listeria monocytogenes]MDA6044972.1 hypothetical protein [Listeria monocytogenes]MWA97746.1 hypothetical protein [Listeria monocytogenes]